ncbi:putative GTPase [Trypanosoma rangeli]|uniref:Putative GTPase n=1 Tax=Trypanosoma rangeli TaxID=5698 RepID=A0A3R7M8S7_TRYRA|nr:putative GTPase [Trypanosoma rangeli]RNF11115.1 putative GTPase [Trypanosoma rangeli]|eukprot:RNF11115.1 putative GTPase [Trypanosoma rangeli]
MGGHSKKHGKGGGGGGAGGGRYRPPEQRKRLTKDPGVPDLKKVAHKLTRTAQNRNRSVFSISAVRGTANILSNVATFDSKSGEPSQTSEERVAAERRAMRTLALQCAEKAYHYEVPQQWVDEAGGEDCICDDLDRRGVDKSLRRFYREFQKVVENSDVLLQVVDARDPLGCRLTQLEKSIRSQFGDERKKMVVVLNKVDLLPSKEVVDSWINFFESHEGVACIPFTATAKGALGHSYVSNMFRRLRALALNEETGARKSIVVGVIGYPNVGKSSIINALKQKHVVGVGNTPGFTTGTTEVELRSDIRVIDCPGVVSPGEDNGDVVLRNAVKVSNIADPFTVVQRLIQRCMQVDTEDEHSRQLLAAGIHPLALFYNIGTFDTNDTIEFIRLVGQRRGRLRQGGAVDEEGTARMILQDWNDGRIAYYTLPPTSDLFDRATLTTTAEEDTAQRIMVAADGLCGPQVVDSLASGLQWEGLPTFHIAWGRREGTGCRRARYDSINTPDYGCSEDVEP